MGCGDGRFLVRCAEKTGAKCVGIEIDADRAQEARDHAARAGVGHLVSVRVGNALDCDLSEATAFFLYLIPRGYRKILPILSGLARPV